MAQKNDSNNHWKSLQTVLVPTQALLSHPVFWSKSQIAEFFCALSDGIFSNLTRPNFPDINNSFKEVIGPYSPSWVATLDEEVAAYIEGQTRPKRKSRGNKKNGKQDQEADKLYDGSKLSCLIRVVRNTTHHLSEYYTRESCLRKYFGCTKDDSVAYWVDKFPRLLPVAYIFGQEVMGIVKGLRKFYPRQSQSHCSSYKFRKEHAELKELFKDLVTKLGNAHRRGEVLRRFNVSREGQELPSDIQLLVVQKNKNVIREHKFVVFEMSNGLVRITKVAHGYPEMVTSHCAWEKQTAEYECSAADCSDDEQSWVVVVSASINVALEQIFKRRFQSGYIFTSKHNINTMERGISGLQEKLKCEIKFEEIILHWDMLDDLTRQKLIKKRVSLQGYTFSLSELLEMCVDKEEERQRLMSLLKGKCLEKLITFQNTTIPPNIIDGTLVGSGIISIERRFQVRNVFSLENLLEYVRAAEGLGVIGLVDISPELLGEKLAAFAEEDSEDLLEKFQVIKDENCDNGIIDHCFRFVEDGWFKWISSNKVFPPALQKYRDGNPAGARVHIISQAKLIAIIKETREHVIISGPSGQGKSIVLKCLANEMMRGEYKSIASYVRFRDFIDLLEENLTIAGIAIALAKLTTLNEFSACLLECMLVKSENYRFDLFIDGIDVIQDGLMRKAYALFEFIKLEFPSVRMVIASRPQHVERLEQILSVFSYQLYQLDDREQVHFISKYWQSKCTPRRAEDGLEEFAKRCIQANSRFTNSMGTPFVCVLLAEIFEGEALQVAHNQVHINSITTRRGFVELIQLYLEKKLAKYISKHILRGISTSHKNINRRCSLFERELDHLEALHEYAAVRECFPSELATLDKFFSPDVKTPRQKIHGYGLVNKGEFVNKLIAEYFVAKFIANRVHSRMGADFELFLVGSVLQTNPERVPLCWLGVSPVKISSSTFVRPYIPYFLNELLKTSNNLHAKISSDSMSVAQFKDIYSASIYFNLEFLLKYLPISKEAMEQYSFIQNVTFCAVRCSSAVSLLCGISKASSTRACDFVVNCENPEFPVISPLHVAISRVDYQLVKYLVEQQGFRKMIQDNEAVCQSLLHACVHRDLIQHKHSIAERTKIIRYLMAINKELVNGKNGVGLSPLECPNAYWVPILELCDLGAGVIEKAQVDSLQHLDISGFSPNDLTELANVIPSHMTNGLSHISRECKFVHLVVSMYRWLVSRAFDTITHNSTCRLIQTCAHLAISSLFPGSSWTCQFGLEQSGKCREELVRMGILQKPGFTFTHSKFADYFTAWFIVYRLTNRHYGSKKEKQAMGDFLWNFVLSMVTAEGGRSRDLRHKYLCYFLNTLIALDDSGKLSNFDLPPGINNVEETVEACVLHGLTYLLREIFARLDHVGEDSTPKNKVFEGVKLNKLLFLAVSTHDKRSEPLISFLIERGASVNATNGQGQSLLEIALRGNKSKGVIHHLLSQGAMRKAFSIEN